MPPGAPVAVTALSGSADSVSLGWTSSHAADGYRVERQTASGQWLPLAELPSDSRDFVDEGLAPESTYRYRLLARSDGEVLGSAQVTTINQQAPSTTAGVLGPELARGLVGPAGVRLASADGQAVVDVPPGAFTAATELVLHSTTNTAPGGQGLGIEISAASVPVKPLRLSLGLGVTPTAAAAGLRVATQRGDGSWLAQRTLVRSPQVLTVALTQSRNASARASAGGLAAAAPFRIRAAVFTDVYLKPETATVPVGGHRELTPYARTLQSESDCSDIDADSLCVPTPVLVEQPLRNEKAGYSRQWYVEGIPSGNSAVGQVATQLGSGAMYIAPDRTPSPNPVNVTFVSQNLKTGRTLALSAQIEIVEPRWTGTLHGTLGGGDGLAFGMSAEGVWTLEPGGTLARFTATGTQSIHVINITCTASASPSSAALPPGSLQIDRSTNPPTYTLDVGSLWDTVITGTCPGQPGQASVPMKVPGKLQVTGPVTGNGTRIEGRTIFGGIDWEWALSSEL